ncbi:MAG: SDR family NAD(P)-dependent oxidoreductase [Pseudomonadales bacterium]|nr:SDR family NAD(P)-dependent oxidoreductase [Pseudomonadales bacterium]
MSLDAIPKMVVHMARRFFSKHPVATPVDLTGKKIIVTGAAVGSIGYLTAKTFASWGATVVVSTRSNTQTVVDALNSDISDIGSAGKVFGYPLDLSRVDSVTQFVSSYRKEHGEILDVLVNNAGIHLDLLSEWKQPKLTEDQYEIHWRTNYLGGFQLTQELIPFLKNSGKETGDARVVNVVSHLHTKGINSAFGEEKPEYNSWQAYGQSKLALVHHAFEIERKYGKQGVHAYAVHPGSVYSNIAHKGLDGHKLLQAVRNSLGFIEKRLLLTTEQGAQTQIYCAVDHQAQPGKYYQRCQVKDPSAETQDEQVAANLWKATTEWHKKVSKVADISKKSNGQHKGIKTNGESHCIF